MCPAIDESNEAFSWGKPNLTLLADYVKQKFGWTKLKFDEIMNPILKKLSQGKSQKLLESYFKIQIEPKSIESAMSKRVQTAVQKLSGKLQDDEQTPASSSKVKKKIEKVKKPRKTTTQKKKKTPNDSGDTPATAENEEQTHANEKTDENAEIVSEEPTISQPQTEELSEQNKRTGTEEEEIDESNGIKVKRRKLCAAHQIDEIIPQRERDKVNALKTKLKAIEIYRKSKIGSNKVKKTKKVLKKLKKDAELSESSDSN